MDSDHVDHAIHLPIRSTPSSASDSISETAGSFSDDQLLNDLTSPSLDQACDLCDGCGNSIFDHEYLGIQKTDKKWHMQCLRCFDCNQSLNKDESCYVKHGKIFCRSDYFNRYGSIKCPTCKSGISPKEQVMKAREFIYHCSCFTCYVCGRLLKTGEQFAMVDSQLYCSDHYASIVRDNQISNSNQDCQQDYHDKTTTMAVTPTTDNSNKSNTNSKGNIKQGCNKSSSTEIDDHNRLKRIRTSFKQPQLRTMKTYFAINHNPDSKDLKQLALKTGLNKRVLQVWFQNARAKYRRSIQQADKTDRGSHNNNTSINMVV